MEVKIRESGEDYLEAILVLKREKGAVRSIDVVRHMNFSKPSVSRAVGVLKANGFIDVDNEGFIELTKSGLEVAQKINERHEFIRHWMIDIGVEKEVAAEEACRIEHVISDATFEKMKNFIQSKSC